MLWIWFVKKGLYMLRKFLVASVVAIHGLSAASAQASVMIESAQTTISDISAVIAYDFASDPNLSFITPESKLIGIEALYTFNPPAGMSGISTMRSSLFIGDNVGVGFDAVVNLDELDGTDAFATNYALKGLAFGTSVTSELFAEPDTVVNAALAGLAADLTVVNDFLTSGGTIAATLRLVYADGDDGGGGNPGVPEPASLLLWGAVGAGALIRRRMKQA